MPKREKGSFRSGPVVCAAPPAATVDPWTLLAGPGDVFRHPREVLAHPSLSCGQKRAILASWASDAHVVESCPTLRCLPGCKAEIVPLDTVLAALGELEAGDDARRDRTQATQPRARRRSWPVSNIRRNPRQRRRDDDDPPPFPAAVMPRPRPPAPPAEAVAVRA